MTSRFVCNIIQENCSKWTKILNVTKPHRLSPRRLGPAQWCGWLQRRRTIGAGQDIGMESDPNKTFGEEITPILQLKRPLLPIDKYAARQRLSRSTVEKYRQLGIIQIRKYKGKTYVVDVPVSPYHPGFEGQQSLQESPKMATQAAGNNEYRMSNTELRNSPALAEVNLSPQKRGFEIQNSGFSVRHSLFLISALAKRIFCKAFKIKNQLSMQDARRKTQDSRLKTQDSKMKARAQRVWQVAAISLIVCLFAAFLACLLLYMNQKVQRGRLDRAYASIQNVYDDYVRTSQQLATLQSKLVESTAELEWVKNEVNNSRAEAKNMRNELTQVTRSLETIQKHNTTALEQLKEQLQKLTDQISKFVNKSQKN